MSRILLIEDLAVVRESLAMALAAHMDVELLCCASVQEGIQTLRASPGRFDVVLLKQSVDGEKADEFLSLANRSGLKNRVLILTAWLSDLERRRLARLGAAGIFFKQRPLADLLKTIRAITNGQTCFERPPAPNFHNAAGNMTGQERKAADLVFEGLSNKEIAARLGVSESCIKALLQRVFLKTGIRNRSQLVRLLSESSGGIRRDPGLGHLTPPAVS